ncbi:glycosyltransferase family 2 protein [Barnesiella sp. WM24]|uniref:glycosyltransferase family A protein n=1 Tax=Barnesiella sp. WM24 TaxID=2558278 RepID=UPI0010718CFF|nr:glycosyltransferase family A protein [Barnesiella sp. WM24]TFU94634.1 glycosyltransferase family 2 protein [Barnesiella sp. WM24]
MSKIDIIKRALIGESTKFKCKLFWDTELNKIRKSSTNNIIPVSISLTSYGERVNKVVPYTIISLLKQTKRPKQIILWLDDANWNKDNIPSKLIDLEKLGLKINFCKDIRSYKKLVPALTFCKGDTLITVDDDIYYSPKFLEEIYSEHLKSPDKIITLNFCYPKFVNGTIDTYSNWDEYHYISDDKKLSKMLIFPQGFGGVLYPPNSLHKDVINESLFMKLAPYADDIWFYIMGILNGTKKQCVINSKTRYYFLDLFRQIRTRDRLHDLNVGESKNDLQLKALLLHYNLSLKEHE